MSRYNIVNSMMDKQLNVIKKYYTDCVLRGLCLCDIAMIPYLHSLVYKILTKERYKKNFAIVCIVASLFLEHIKAWNRIIRRGLPIRTKLLL